jgi:hypothetical protein
VVGGRAVSGSNFNLVQGQTETGQITVASDGSVEAFWTAHAGSKTAVAPNPNTACPAGFGDTDTELGIVLQ